MKRTIPLAAAAAIAVLITGCGSAEPSPSASTSPSVSTTSSATTPESPPLDVVHAQSTLVQGSVKDPCSPTREEVEALDQSLLDAWTTTQTDAHGFTVAYLDTECTEKKAARKAAAAQKAAAAAIKNPRTYKAISKRAFAKVLRDPDSYVGKKYVVYAEVTQFDSATGTDTFRGDVAHADIRDYGYWIGGENAMFEAGAADLDDIVQDDVVKMYVEVAGSLSYDTQIGGSTTVPQFTVNIIKRIGSSK